MQLAAALLGGRLGGGSAAGREARGRQRCSEGLGRLGGGSAARGEARRWQRGSEGASEAAARLGGTLGGGSARLRRRGVGVSAVKNFYELESVYRDS